MTAVGIDIGTTFTAAAVARDGRVETIMLDQTTVSIPTVVHIGDGEELVGRAALSRAVNNPEGLVTGFKRQLGRDEPLVVGGRYIHVETLMSRVLTQTVATIVEQQGSLPDSTALTHPANWSDYRLEQYRGIANAAGITDPLLIPEPCAAARFLASTDRVPEGALIAVYDFGGGTFDATVVKMTSAGITILGTPLGDDRLGGLDVDREVQALVIAAVGDRWSEVDPDDPEHRRGLRSLETATAEAKVLLSSALHADVPVRVGPVETEVRITRGELEDRIRPLIDLSVERLETAVHQVNLTPQDLHAVLLVGGSSRIPLVSEVVQEALGIPVRVDAHPKLAIASGAALEADEVNLDLEQPVAPPPTEPTPPVVPVRPAPPEPPESPPVETPHEERKWPDRRSLVPWLTGAGIVIAAILVLLVWRPWEDDDPVVADGGTDTSVTANTAEQQAGFDLAANASEWSSAETGGQAADAIVQDVGDAFRLDGFSCTETARSELDAAGPQLDEALAGLDDIEWTRRYLRVLSVYEALCANSALAASPRLATYIGNADGYLVGRKSEADTCLEAQDVGDNSACAIYLAPTRLALETIPIAVQAGDPVVAGGFVWSPGQDSGVLSKVDPNDPQAEFEPLEIPGGVGRTTAIDDELWVTQPGAVRRVDPSTGFVGEAIPVGPNPWIAVEGAGAVWVPDLEDGSLWRVDPETDSSDPVPPIPGADGRALVAADSVTGEVWYATQATNEVWLLDPSTGDSLGTTTVSLDPTQMVQKLWTAFGSLWIDVRSTDPESLEPAVLVRDPFGSDPATITVGVQPAEPVIAFDEIWLPNQTDGTVSVIDPETNSVVDTIEVGGSPIRGHEYDGAVWIPIRSTGTIARIEPDHQISTCLPISTGMFYHPPVSVGGAMWVAEHDIGELIRIEQAESIAARGALCPDPDDGEDGGLASTTVAPLVVQECDEGSLCGFITGIEQMGDSFVVAYETVGFDPDIDDGDHHVHFFWGSVTPDQSGRPGVGPWQIWDRDRGGGELVFNTADADNDEFRSQPEGASEICVSVADREHFFVPEPEALGSCVPLPGP